MCGFYIHHVQPDIPAPKHPIFLAHEKSMRFFKQHVLGEAIKLRKTLRKRLIASFAQQQFAFVVAHQFEVQQVVVKLKKRL